MSIIDSCIRVSMRQTLSKVMISIDRITDPHSLLLSSLSTLGRCRCYCVYDYIANNRFSSRSLTSSIALIDEIMNESVWRGEISGCLVFDTSTSMEWKTLVGLKKAWKWYNREKLSKSKRPLMNFSFNKLIKFEFIHKLCWLHKSLFRFYF